MYKDEFDVVYFLLLSSNRISACSAYTYGISACSAYTYRKSACSAYMRGTSMLVIYF